MAVVLQMELIVWAPHLDIPKYLCRPMTGVADGLVLAENCQNRSRQMYPWKAEEDDTRLVAGNSSNNRRRSTVSSTGNHRSHTTAKRNQGQNSILHNHGIRHDANHHHDSHQNRNILHRMNDHQVSIHCHRRGHVHQMRDRRHSLTSTSKGPPELILLRSWRVSSWLNILLSPN